MRIALLTDGIAPLVVGGMQKHSYYLVKYLLEKGTEVDLYTSVSQQHGKTETADYQSIFQSDNLNVWEFDFPKVPYFPGHYLLESYRLSQHIYRSIVDQLICYDFIYAQGFTAWYLLKKRCLNGTGTGTHPPVCVNFHGLNMYQKPAGLRQRLEFTAYRPFVKKNISQADFVQSLGGKLTAILNRLEIPSHKIWEIPIGVDKSWVQSHPTETHEERKFIFIGRYDRLKGIEELTRVLKELNGTPGYHFDFVGPIPSSLQIDSEQVSYRGQINDQDRLKEIVRSKDILICPSFSEGMPTVILEAMASGLAVIATDVGAVSLQVSSDNGWLIPPGDYRKLHSVFSEAIRFPANRLNNMKEKSIKKVRENFLWEKTIEKTLGKIKQSLQS